jgi:hypothetical protein
MLCCVVRLQIRLQTLTRESGLPQSRVMCANNPKLGPTHIKQLEARISDYFPEYFNRDMTIPWLFGSPLLVNEEALAKTQSADVAFDRSCDSPRGLCRIARDARKGSVKVRAGDEEEQSHRRTGMCPTGYGRIHSCTI